MTSLYFARFRHWQPLRDSVRHDSGRQVKTIIARPLKIAGRVVLGPRLVGKQYARIVALANGAGRIEIYDSAAEAWRPAPDTCSFTLLWSAAPAPLTLT